MNEENYYPIDASGDELKPLTMDSQALMAQIDVCGKMVNYVNEFATGKTREHLNRATYELRRAFIVEQKSMEKEA